MTGEETTGKEMTGEETTGKKTTGEETTEEKMTGEETTGKLSGASPEEITGRNKTNTL